MSEQGDLFSGPTRPEDDPFVRQILERFSGQIVNIGPVRERDEVTWIETIRPQARRARWSAGARGVGKPEAVQLDETIKLGRYSSYEKAQPKGSSRPWQLVWSGSREPLGIGLFTTKELAEANRRR